MNGKHLTSQLNIFLTFEWLPRLGVVQQGLGLVPEHLCLVRIVFVVECVNKDTAEVPGQLVLLPQDPVKLGRPELLGDRGVRLHPDSLGVLSVVPVCRLQDRVIPELPAEHFLKQRDHRPEAVCHPVVRLLEGDDEHVDVLDLVPQRGHQVLDRLLLLEQLVAEARGVDHREPRPGGVPLPVALVRTCPLRDAVKT